MTGAASGLALSTSSRFVSGETNAGGIRYSHIDQSTAKAIPALNDVDPDAELLKKIAAGDEMAVRELMNRHIDWMLACSYRMLGTREDAEEVAQEAFLRVWKVAGTWEFGRAKFRTWINRVTVNLCYDRLRKKREVATEEAPEQVDESGTPADRLHQNQVAARVRLAIDQLPERQKAAIVLCHHQGLSNGEAADIMDVSVEAIESLLSRGRRKLRQILKPEIENLLA